MLVAHFAVVRAGEVSEPGEIERCWNCVGRQQKWTNQVAIGAAPDPTMRRHGRVEWRIPGREDGGIVNEPSEQGARQHWHLLTVTS
ncbi:hypothetical protein GCM10009811_10110 [Nostocoides veronense]|uniref:Uncharacterized protein n=1 Tax=Nostocoides veronense TaxID=330836 RepID=A0ABN2LFX0_9MICO